jgi:2-polyprenyl-3-methyl-5-hydroxy-6-metoxy-1,4-benzoquinol methylase
MSMTAPTFTDGAAAWNKRFEGEDYLFGREPNEYLRAQVGHIVPGGRVLCVADGEGRNSVWLARQGFQVQAFDVSPVGVAKARTLATEARANVDYHVADCDAWAWQTGSHDAVVAIFIQFADPALRQRLFTHMAQSLKPGGVLVLQGYTPPQLEYKTGGPGVLSHLYTAAMLREAFAALEIVDLVEYEVELNEGSRHTGRSALVGLVARQP